MFGRVFHKPLATDNCIYHNRSGSSSEKRSNETLIFFNPIHKIPKQYLWRGWLAQSSYPASNYMLKVNDRNTIQVVKICSKLTIKTPEQRQWRYSGVFNVNFEHISYLFLVFLVSVVNFGQVNASWVASKRQTKFPSLNKTTIYLYQRFQIANTYLYSFTQFLSSTSELSNKSFSWCGRNVCLCFPAMHCWMARG